MSKQLSQLRVIFSSIIGPALIIQFAPTLGMLATFFVSLFYFGIDDTRYPVENPLISLFFIFVNLLLFLIGLGIQGRLEPKEHISLRRGAWIVFWAWVIACSVSSLYFIAHGIPVPGDFESFSLVRVFIDGFYETMSGYTTTGASILPSVEVFPRSMLFWRTLLHWIGGMGIAYMAVTLWKNFKSSRQAVINSESEAHEIVEFSSTEEARDSGFSFLKAYVLLSGVLFGLLLVAGSFTRITPYTYWYDNAFDAITHTFSVIGTGGFSTYDLSAGLPTTGTDSTHIIIGGLQNPVAEWIISFFMVFSGINFSLWYILFFLRDKKGFFTNKEHKVYWAYILFCTFGIIGSLLVSGTYEKLEQAARYAFFNVASVVSTTGLGNWDFTTWPAAALGFLFVCYLVGSMVGSTGGGPKVIRYIVSYHHIKRLLKRLIYGHDYGHFEVDGIKYDSKKSGLVLASVAIYFLFMVFGTILIMIVSGTGVLPTGEVIAMNFSTAFSASLANLGNIGPGVSFAGNFNIGPTGNYFAFSTLGKVVLIILMYIGRVGVLAILMLFLKSRGEAVFADSVMIAKYDKDMPVLRQ